MSTAPPGWHVGCDSPCWFRPRRTIYFLWRRDVSGRVSHYEDRSGRLRTWKHIDMAKAFAAKANARKEN